MGTVTSSAYGNVSTTPFYSFDSSVGNEGLGGGAFVQLDLPNPQTIPFNLRCSDAEGSCPADPPICT